MNFPEIEMPTLFDVSKIITIFKLDLRESNTPMPKPQKYSFWIMCFIKDGEYYFKKDGKINTVKNGGLFFIAPNEQHDSPGRRSSCVMHQLAFVPVSENLDFLKDRVFYSEKLYETANTLFQKGVKFFYWNGDFCSNSGMSVFSDIPKTDLYTLRLTMQSLLCLLYEEYKAECIGTVKKQSSDSTLFSEAIAFMKKNIAKNITISDISSALGVSPSTLKALFSRKCDCGVMSYFSELRFKHAKKLLSEGMRVNEVAETLGFSSTSYFSRFFKSRSGISPINYKE